MKRWLKVLIGVAVVLAVLLVALALFAGHMVKGAINTAGPKLLGVPVSVGGVHIGLLTGRFGLSELVVGNPEGFQTPEAMRLRNVTAGVRMGSLFSKVLVIESIHVEAPEITYEVGLRGSNLRAIQDKLGPSTPSQEPVKPAEPAGEAKKVQIDDFLVEQGKIHVSTVGMAGHSAAIPLPTIHLTDIGKESGGATPQEVVAKLLGAINSTVSGAAAEIGKGVQAIGKSAAETGKALGEGAKDVGKAADQALEDIQGIFKKEKSE